MQEYHIIVKYNWVGKPEERFWYHSIFRNTEEEEHQGFFKLASSLKTLKDSTQVARYDMKVYTNYDKFDRAKRGHIKPKWSF